MLANLPSVCLLLLGIVKASLTQPMDSNTVIAIISLVEMADLNDDRHFYLDDQQCTGYISKGDLCNDLKPLGVLVKMSDSLAPPLIHIDSSRSEARVARVPDDSGRCNGRASIEVKLRCEGPLPQRGLLRNHFSAS